MKLRYLLCSTVLLLTMVCPAAFAEEPEPPPVEQPPISLNEITQVEQEVESPILKDIQTVSQDGSRYIIKIYETTPGYDPARLSEGPFDKNGYHYADCTILRISENYSEDTKLACQTVTVNGNTKEGAAAKFAPFVDYSDGQYSGQLKLDRSSIYTEAAGSKRYSYGVTDTREFSGLQRNDTYYIPKSVTKNGLTLGLADVNWTAMGDGLYKATAAYTGTGSGSKVTGYLSTGTYLGEVESRMLKSVTYKVIYEGTAILPEPFNWTPWLIAGSMFVLLAAIGFLLWHFRRNARLYAMLPDGKYKVIRKYRIQCEDPVVDLSSPFMRQYEDFLVTVDRFAAGRLAGSIARILLGGGDYVLRTLDWNGSVCCIHFHVDWPRADLNAVEDKYEMAPAEDADIGTAGFNPPASDTGE